MMSAFAADMGMDDNANCSMEQVVGQPTKCKGQPAAFIQKLYRMIDTCDPHLACWTTDGDMFVIKDPQIFEQMVIPKFFIHNKFSSFARQLNFYRFRKVHSRPIRNADCDATTAKHTAYYHPSFQRGRTDLLIFIKRPTKDERARDQPRQQEIERLNGEICSLQTRLSFITSNFDERVARLSEEYLQEIRSLHRSLHAQLPRNTIERVQWPERIPSQYWNAGDDRAQQLDEVQTGYPSASVPPSSEKRSRNETNLDPLPYIQKSKMNR